MKADTTHKSWGAARHAAREPIQVDLLDVMAGGYSSVHQHGNKHNLFLLISGALDVLVYADETIRLDVTPEPAEVYKMREAGDCVVVEQKIWHSFMALEQTKLVEVYYAASVDPVDIRRMTENGTLNEAELAAYRDRHSMRELKGISQR